MALAAPAVAQAAAPTQIKLGEQNASGEHGTATLLDGANGLIVRVRVSGYPEGVAQPAHVHRGTCAHLDPKPAYGLHAVANGLSETTVPNVTLAELHKGAYAINVHKSGTEPAIYVACGNLSTP